MQSEQEPVDRRELLLRAVTATSAIGLTGMFLGEMWVGGADSEGRPPTRVAPTRPAGPRRTFTKAQWNTIEAAFDRLLPQGDPGPGARDVNAVGYADAALADPLMRPARRETFLRAAALLDGLARRRSVANFSALPPPRQDDVLAEFEQRSVGLAWMRSALGLVFEACLGDPVHGGNPSEIGWAWADMPRPRPRPPHAGWRPTER